ADGRRAWLIVRHEEARAALNDAGLSKDIHAALARDGAVVAEGLPGPAFARHMLSVDPPDHTRLRRLASAAFSRPRIAALRPRVQAIADGLLDDLEARGEAVADLVKGFAFPLPFTVISELLGVPEPDRDHLGTWFTTLLTPSSAPEPPAEAAAASAKIVQYLTRLLARKRTGPALHVPVRHPRHRPRRDRHPGLRPGNHLPGRGQPGPGPVRQPGNPRHRPGGHQSPGLRPRHPPLPGCPAGPPRGRDSVHRP